MLSRAIALFLGLALVFPITAQAVIHDIAIQSFDFVPGNQTINQGDTVRWTNNDGVPHTSTSDSGIWNSGNLAFHQTYMRAFTSLGSFPYHCAIHTTMKDTLTVISVPTFDVQIDIGENFFAPAVVQINVGQTIRWINNGAMAHTSTANDGLWDSGSMDPGATFDFTFEAEGVHDYFCQFHSGMVGTVIVGIPDSVVQDIQIVDFAFSPDNVEVTVGQYVRWINFGEMPHTSTENLGLWDSGTLEPGDVFILHADSVGMFDYICSIHPAMTGMLTVTPPVDYEISMMDNFFDPAVIQIQPGQTVRWMNMGTRDHTSTSDDGIWDSGILAPGEHFIYTFNSEGVFDYHCEMHPLVMKGTAIVGKPDSIAFDIQIIDNAFVPAETTITIGDNIRWINFGAMDHTVTDTSFDHFDSGTLIPGDVFTLHADLAEVFNYICTFHPGMVGTLTVLDTASGGNCNFIIGDINGSGTANGIDVTYGVGYFKGGPPPPVSCDCPPYGNIYPGGDVNGNCAFNGIDISFYVSYLKGGAVLSSCPNCPTALQISPASVERKQELYH